VISSVFHIYRGFDGVPSSRVKETIDGQPAMFVG
jgi:hypothetical protein